MIARFTTARACPPPEQPVASGPDHCEMVKVRENTSNRNQATEEVTDQLPGRFIEGTNEVSCREIKNGGSGGT